MFAKVLLGEILENAKNEENYKNIHNLVGVTAR
mgnify:CR=1 FL=1